MGGRDYLLRRKAKREAIHRFALQGFSLERVQDLKPLETGEWLSCSEDPFFLMRVEGAPVGGISIAFSMVQDAPSDCYLYYGYEEDNGQIFPENRIRLSLRQCEEGLRLAFERPVSAIRLDPMENRGPFRMERLRITAEPEPSLGKQRLPRDFYVCSAEYGQKRLAQRVKSGKLDPTRMVLLITHEMTKTGAPQLCAKLEEEFVRRGYAVVILSLQRSEELYEQFEKNAEWIFFAQTESERTQILSGLARIGICKALCNTVATGCCAKQLAREQFFNLTLVHEMEISCRLNGGVKQLSQIAEYADHIIFPARIVEKEFLSLLEERQIPASSEILPQGIYKEIGNLPDKERCAQWVKEKYGIPEQGKIVLSAGVQGLIKGTDLIPLLAQRLQKTQLHFLWLGNCSDRLFGCTLQKMLRKMNLADRVHLEEYVSDAADYAKIMAGADVFLLPSREDSYPSVLLEAMACGTVTVAFEGSGGAQELLGEERGVLVPFLDLEQMAHAVWEIAQRPECYEQMRKNAFERVRKKASFASYVDRIIKILFSKEKE